MEFSEIGEKFEGLNADQVYNLAKFGKEILGINGSVTLARCLLHSWMITTTEKPDALS